MSPRHDQRGDRTGDRASTEETARLVRVTGALAEARPLASVSRYELVRVGEQGLMGEVLRIDGDRATLQIHEETAGLGLGEPVHPTGGSLTVELGPGLLGSILDGVGRRLELLQEVSGPYLRPGLAAPTLDPARRWTFEPAVAPGVEVSTGDVIGTASAGNEKGRSGFVHRILVPPCMGGAGETVRGRIARIGPCRATVHEPVAELEDGRALRLAHAWPVRRPRPVGRRLESDRPLVTGQRVLDLLFPVAEGGTVAVPGGFGTGKTVVEQSLAKHAAADVVVFVGCGERGNEIAELLEEFPKLEDPRTGRPLMDRSVLVVNTSNMPVVAREASIYLGITIAEYFRDQGLGVAVLVDSLSRWAEALREIGGRLQEMPGEEGYPTYLASRLGQAYERADRVETLGRPLRTGALTVMAAVSPPGGDFSEPVTQATIRLAGGLWALDAELARERHFPAIDWQTSYSLFVEATAGAITDAAGEDWAELRRRCLELLQEESELREIAALIGLEALQDRDRLTLETATILREELLAQNAFDPVDAFCPVAKTCLLARLLVDLLDRGRAALDTGTQLETLDLAAARGALVRVRRAPAGELETERDAARETLLRAVPETAAESRDLDGTPRATREEP